MYSTALSRLSQSLGRGTSDVLQFRNSRLNDPRFPQRRVCAVPVDGFNGACREIEAHGPSELRHKKSFFLQVRLPAAFARRVELRRSRAVRIAAADLRAFQSDGA